ncbi:acyl carrier protein [Burkholderia sp. MS455]|uniref:Acyl carrier protein n=2 Tax=Burkholderia cepacia complex TaxID=87882 RepID=A0A087NZT5_BURPY|nr:MULTISPECIES: phosphopantetheine-binding protein [Burkholderia]KFL54638.1 acyl carrier protein [Burkholderia pyrrocinia]PQP17586.1 acyl carrier protein [Burkholderia cepacia]PXX40586.1 acyl carrier protein [Burkholderia pyrrocinia]QRR06766.1 acyl carrier protein [Burkholderia sp. MS455]UOB58844.1 phosphopantetheine-binding protein [Burkholderia pyrrocinia]
MDTLKLQIKQLLIEMLDLNDMTIDDIGDDVPLFSTDGIGLDSVDALEVGIMLRKKFQLSIAANDEHAKAHFRSINTLAAFIVSQQAHHAPQEAVPAKGV